MYQNKQQQLDLDIEKINKLILDNIERKKIKLDQFKNNYILNNPVILYQNYMKELNNFLEKLELLNPISVLKKGYSLTYYNGTILSSIKTVKKDDFLNIRLYDGTLDVVVKNVGGLDGKEN